MNTERRRRGRWGQGPAAAHRARQAEPPEGGPYLGAPAAGCETSPRAWAGPLRHGPCPLPAAAASRPAPCGPAIARRLGSRRHLQHRTALSGLRPHSAPLSPALPSPAGRRRCFSSQRGSRQSARRCGALAPPRCLSSQSGFKAGCPPRALIGAEGEVCPRGAAPLPWLPWPPWR